MDRKIVSFYWDGNTGETKLNEELGKKDIGMPT